jgi:DNA-binding MarR family transcriptional regulator
LKEQTRAHWRQALALMPPARHKESESMTVAQSLEVIGLLFRSVNVNFRQAIDKGLRDLDIGVTFGEISPMSILRFRPGINGAQLARHSLVSPQAMNGILRQLVEKKYIERRAHPDNLRADSWYLTDKGARLLDRARSVFDEVTLRMVSGLNLQQVRSLEGYLRSCATSLGNGGDDISAPSASQLRSAPSRKPAKR